MTTTRVGIDFGNTIGEIDQSEPFPGCIAMTRHLVFKFGPSNVFIVSKAQPAMQQQIENWLERQNFYVQTGLLQQNVIFVRNYVDKATIVQELNISIFLDDSSKVVRALAPLPEIQRIFWMHAKDVRLIQLIPKEYRSKIVLSPNGDWNNTMKFFQKIPKR